MRAAYDKHGFQVAETFRIAQFHIEKLKSSNMDLIQQGEKVFKI